MLPSCFETDRFEARPFRPRDREVLGALFSSNAAFLALTGETPEGALASEIREGAQEGRVLLVYWDKSTGDAVGVLSLLARNPRDGRPWLGLLMVHGERQGRGLGREMAKGALRHAASLRWASLRLGVLASNPGALRFWTSLGFREVDQRMFSCPAGDVPIRCLERCLGDEPS